MATTGDKDKPRIDLGLGAILAAAEKPAAEVSVDLPLSDVDGWTLGAHSPQALRSPYEQLADKREWTEIVRRAEAALATDPSVEARVWWIRGHLGAFSMPVTLLSAPMESLCRGLDISSLSPEVKGVLRETVLLTVGRLEEMGQRDQCESLRAAMTPLDIKPERDANGRERKVTSSFRIADFSLPAQDVSVSVLPAAEPSPARRPRWGLTSLAGVAMALAVVVVGLWDPLNLFIAQLDTAPEAFVIDASGVEQSVEQLERKNPVGRLGALFYAIEENSGNSVPPGSVNPAGTLVPLRPSAPVDTEVPLSGRIVSQDDGPKERVNTKGPVEGREFRERIERRSVAESDQRGAIQGGPPRAVLPVPPRDEAFEAGRVYRVVVSTSVVSAPSFGGRVIGQLGAGDRVLVEGFLGRWLRLRSRRGRGGYVLSADVEEVPSQEGVGR